MQVDSSAKARVFPRDTKAERFRNDLLHLAVTDDCQQSCDLGPDDDEEDHYDSTEKSRGFPVSSVRKPYNHRNFKYIFDV